MFDFIPGDTTKQGSQGVEFDDDPNKSPVAQVETDGGPRQTRLEVGPGFAASAAPGERVVSMEDDGVLYGIGGGNAAAVASLGLQGSDRAVYAVDPADTKRVIAKMVVLDDGSVLTTTDKGNTLIKPDGEVSINDGNLRVLPKAAP